MFKFNKSKHATSKLAIAALTVVGAMLPTAGHADALAQAILEIRNFSITTGVGAVVVPGAPAPNAAHNASLVGSGTCGQSNIGLLSPNVSCAVGPNLGLYNPYAPNQNVSPNAPIGTFAGSAVSVSGNSLLPGGATAKTDNTVSLLPKGDGAANSNTNLSNDFTVNVTAASTLTFDFNAFLFLRAYLTSGSSPFIFGNSTAISEWGVNIRNSTGQLVFSWNPNGGAGGITGVGATEIFDSFDLNGNDLSVNSNNKDFSFNSQSAASNPGLLNAFRASTGELAVGLYTVTVSHETRANSLIEIPEPTSLALIGIAMLGAAAATRRRKVATL